jgi:arsenate reductase
MAALTIYAYANCDTCRRALKWLRAHGLVFEERAIRETPPGLAELKTMLAAHDGDRRRLFNASGRDYRELKLGEKLATLTDHEMFGLLSKNGNLVKRPFLIGGGVALVGLDEEVWAKALLKK